MKFSIIIPVQEINEYIRFAMPHYRSLEGDFEILIFPDESSDESFLEMGGKVRVIPSGKVGPAEKRDMALQYAAGDIFAFTDDDAYPDSRWLVNAEKYFKHKGIGAVGGPAVTAPEDGIRQQASGKIYESWMCSGQYTYRYLPQKRRYVDDLPSVNLMVRADLFRAVGGYDSHYYPGEDTKLCLDIVNSGKKIVYDPDVLVYHHRRKVFAGHLRQATNYGLHRGFFAKRLPGTSRKPAYFVPSAFVVFLGSYPAVRRLPEWVRYGYGAVLALYLALVAASIKKPVKPEIGVLAFFGIIATHIGYGINFIRGIVAKELPR